MEKVLKTHSDIHIHILSKSYCKAECRSLMFLKALPPAKTQPWTNIYHFVSANTDTWLLHLLYYCIHAPTLCQVSQWISARILQDTTLSEIINAATEENQFRSHTSRWLSLLSGIFLMLWYHQTRFPHTILQSTHAFTIPAISHRYFSLWWKENKSYSGDCKKYTGDKVHAEIRPV